MDGRSSIDSVLGADNLENLGITPSIQLEGKPLQRLCDFSKHLSCKLVILEESASSVCFDLIYRCPDFDGFSSITEHYLLDAKGLQLTAVFDTVKPCVCGFEVPLLLTNGTLESSIEQEDTHKLTVLYEGRSYCVHSDCQINLDSCQHRNRNGIYRSAKIYSPGNQISIHLEIILDSH